METSSQLNPVRNSYATIMDQLVTVSLNTCSKMHTQIKHSPAHLQDEIPALAGIKCIKDNTSCVDL